MFLLLIIFIVINMKKQPFMTVVLNDLETLSLVTSMITVYCGLFYLSDTPQKYIDDYPELSSTAMQLSNFSSLMLFFIILFVNILFFSFWLYYMFLEVKNKFRKKAEKLYLWVFLCGNVKRLEEEKRLQIIEEENEVLREQYLKIIDRLRKLQEDNTIILNRSVIERARVYLGDERYLHALGISTEDELDWRDRKRQARVHENIDVNLKG